MSKYYLQINDNIIPNLEGYYKYGDLTNFVCLNLFTSDFDSIKDVGEELKRLGVLPDDVTVKKMEIVNYYRGKYYFVSSSPLLKADYPFFDIKAVKSFFDRVISHNLFFYYEEIKELLQDCCYCLEGNLSHVNDSDVSKSEYRKILNRRISNIERLEKIIEEFEQEKESPFHLVDEYRERLREFIDDETQNRRDGKILVNYRGLLKLAKAISRAVKPYGNKYTGYRNMEPKIKIVTPKVIEEDQINIDDFMFLEEEDFYSTYDEKNEDVIEDQLANLEEKKRRL